MYKFCKAIIATVLVAVGLAAGNANATFINGSIGIGDSGITLTALPGAIVNTLTSVTLGATVATGPCTLDFAACPALTPATSIVLPVGLGAMTGSFTSGIFTFTFGNVVSITRTASQNIGGGLITDHLGFIATGTVTGAGFQTTTALISFNATGNCIGTGTNCNAGTATATWQATLSAAGTNTQVPEPGTLALIGIALAGLGFARRKQA